MYRRKHTARVTANCCCHQLVRSLSRQLAVWTGSSEHQGIVVVFTASPGACTRKGLGQLVSMLVSVGISATQYIDVNVETVISSHFKCLHLKGLAANSRLLDTKSSLSKLKTDGRLFGTFQHFIQFIATSNDETDIRHLVYNNPRGKISGAFTAKCSTMFTS